MDTNSTKLQALPAVGEQLHQADDALSERLEKAEDAIRGSGLDLTEWLESEPIAQSNWRVIDHEDDNVSNLQMTEITDHWLLGGAELLGKWRIAAKQVEVVRGDGTYSREGSEPTPLACAPLHVRMEAAPLLGKLIDQLAARASEYVGNVAVADLAVQESLRRVQG